MQGFSGVNKQYGKNVLLDHKNNSVFIFEHPLCVYLFLSVFQLLTEFKYLRFLLLHHSIKKKNAQPHVLQPGAVSKTNCKNLIGLEK